MSESNLWEDTRVALSPYGRLERIENLVGKGTPDAAFALRHLPSGRTASGFIEMKHVGAAPELDSMPLRIRGLTRDQVMWMESWTNAGGRACVLLRIGGRQGLHVFMPSPLVRAVFGGLDWGSVKSIALETGEMTQGVRPAEWVAWLTRS